MISRLCSNIRNWNSTQLYQTNTRGRFQNSFGCDYLRHALPLFIGQCVENQDEKEQSGTKLQHWALEQKKTRLPSKQSALSSIKIIYCKTHQGTQWSHIAYTSTSYTYTTSPVWILIYRKPRKKSWYSISKITEYRGRDNLKICFIQLPNCDWDAPTNAKKFNSPQKIMVPYFLESQVIQLVCQTAYVVHKSHKRSNTTMEKPLPNCLLTLKILFSIMSTVPGRTDANSTSYIKNLIFISFLGHERHIPN